MDFQFDVGAGARFLQGAPAKGVDDLSAYGVALGGHAGYYFTRHLGVLAGAEVSLGATGKGCVAVNDSGKGCGSMSLKLPVVLQYAITDRRHGAFFEAGASLINYHVFTATPAPDAFQSVELFSPVDLALGAGYRMGGSISNTKLPIEITLRTDIGQYTSITETLKLKSTEVASGYKFFDAGDRAFHVAVVLGAAVVF